MRPANVSLASQKIDVHDVNPVSFHYKVQIEASRSTTFGFIPVELEGPLTPGAPRPRRKAVHAVVRSSNHDVAQRI